MQEDGQITDKSKIATTRRDISDLLGANDYDRMQKLDLKFAKLGLSAPTKEDYALMQDTTIMLQKVIQDSSDIEYTDYDLDEVAQEFYEGQLDETEGKDLRGRAVIDFVVDLLKCAFEALEEPGEEEKEDIEADEEEGVMRANR